MKKLSSSSKILIAGCASLHKNYENALQQAGFSCLYPTSGICTADKYVFSDLADYSYDLLLLPGGGDIPASLYLSDSHVDITAKCSPPDYASDLLQFLLLQSAVVRKKPILGICKGMQIINVFFGGDLYPHLPTADEHQYQKADQFHMIRFAAKFPDKVRIFGQNTDCSNRLFQLLADYPVVNSAHHQGIRRLGKDLVTVQYAHDYLPETIAHRFLPILGLQWHPERLPGFTSESMKKMLCLLLKSARL